MYFCFKQETAYEVRISDWSSDVCSSDLHAERDMKMTAEELDTMERIVFNSWTNSFKNVMTDFTADEFINVAILNESDMSKRRKIGRASCRERVCQYV